jgi:hypothetical protein
MHILNGRNNGKNCRINFGSLGDLFFETGGWSIYSYKFILLCIVQGFIAKPEIKKKKRRNKVLKPSHRKLTFCK